MEIEIEDNKFTFSSLFQKADDVLYYNDELKETIYGRISDVLLFNDVYTYFVNFIFEFTSEEKYEMKSTVFFFSKEHQLEGTVARKDKVYGKKKWKYQCVVRRQLEEHQLQQPPINEAVNVKYPRSCRCGANKSNNTTSPYYCGDKCKCLGLCSKDCVCNK